MTGVARPQFRLNYYFISVYYKNILQHCLKFNQG